MVRLLERRIVCLLAMLAGLLSLLCGCKDKLQSRNEGDRDEEWKALVSQAETDKKARNLAGAERNYLEAIVRAEKNLGPVCPEIESTTRDLAYMYEEEGQFAKAEPMYKKLIELRAQLQGVGSQDHRNAQIGLAGLYESWDRQEDAEKIYLDILDSMRKDLGSDSAPRLIEILGILGVHYFARQDYARAETMFRETLDRRRALWGNVDQESIALSLSNVGLSLSRQKKFEEAEKFLLDAQGMYERLKGSNHKDTVDSLRTLGSLYRTWGKYDQAELVYERARVVQEAVGGRDSSEMADILISLGIVNIRKGDQEKADRLIQQGMGVRELLDGKDSYSMAETCDLVASHLTIMKRFDDAEALFQRAFVITERLYGPDSSKIVEFYEDYAAMLRARGNVPAATEYEAKAAKIKTMNQAAGT